MQEKIVAEPSDKPQGPAGQDLLSAALAYAARGWPIFPCRHQDEPLDAPGTKVEQHKAKCPLTFNGHKDATTNGAQIEEWWTRWPQALIGMPTGERVGVWVLDVDVAKKEGAPSGEDTLAKLEAEHGPLPETVEQRTGSGGRHLLFLYPEDGRAVGNSTSALGKNLDVRGNGGYVIIPPSGHPSGGRYEWTKTPKRGTKMAAAPDWLLDLVARKPAKKVDTSAPAVELDQEWNILDAMTYLKEHAPPAVEGAGGEFTTLKVAMHLRDKGVSEETALELMLRLYNERCEPEWEADELAGKVRNAYRYASRHAPGANTAEAAFKDCWTPPEDTGQAKGNSDPGQALWDRVNLLDYRIGRYLKARPAPGEYAFGGLRIGTVGIIVGPPGTGKTHLAQHIGAAVATGNADHMDGLFTVPRKGRVVILSAEDDEWGVHDRIWRQFGEVFDGFGVENMQDTMDAERAKLKDNLIVFPTAGLDLRLTRKDRTNIALRDGVFDGLLNWLQGVPDLRLVVLDPLVKFYGGEENDNIHADHFINALVRLALTANCAVLISHHTVKGYAKAGGSKFDLDMALSQEAARGASAFTGAVAWQYNLVPLPAAVAKKISTEVRVDGEYLAGRVSKNRYGTKAGVTIFHVDAGGMLHVHPGLEGGAVTTPLEARVLTEIQRQEAQGEQLWARTPFAEHYAKQWKEHGATVHGLRGVLAAMVSRGHLFEVTRRYGRRASAYLSTKPDAANADEG